MNRAAILSFLESDNYKPMKLDDLVMAMSVSDNDLKEFCTLLIDLEKEGYIIVNRKNRYGLSKHMGLIRGVLQGNAKGFAFLIPDDKTANDVFIPTGYMNSALNGDEVLVRITKTEDPRATKVSGEVVRILSRANEKIVGIYEASRNFGFVRPDEKRLGQDIFIPHDGINKAKNGDRVVVTITKWPELKRSAEGTISEIIGNANQPGVDILTIIRKFNLREDFPPEVLQEADRVGIINPNDKVSRKDLRDVLMVTMDGANAKDLDDAVSLSVLDNGNLHLGVHIADVGHYVPVGSKLDHEAYLRGTSVYLPDRVIPMLPQKLSNDICSLNPNVDRLSLSCLMEITPKGKVVNSEICESVINIDERMTYDDVNAILDDKDADLSEQYSGILEMLRDMNDLRLILTSKRDKRGALLFDFPEAEVILDDKGVPIDIVKRVQGTAEMIIEEFMIIANETVASEYFYRDIPFIYRVHEPPKEDSVVELRDFLSTMGYPLHVNSRDIKSHTYQKLLKSIKDTPEEKLINMVVLRSLSHARYDTKNYGHFGLASENYSHFTSPIRRYPDLSIHRVIKSLIHNSVMDDDRYEKLCDKLTEAANQSSLQERIAEQAERESTDMKKTQYMEHHIGETFAGVISGVASYGFFVELDNTVNGLVHVSNLEDDYYEYHDKQKALVGTRGNNVYKLGDKIMVIVTRVDVESRLVDFEVAPSIDINNKSVIM